MCQAPSKQERNRRYRLSEIYERYFSDYIGSADRNLSLKDKHFEAIDKSISCRTKKLGICEIVCRGCGELKEIRRSCKHRFCGRCGSLATNQWSETTLRRLMNIPHHHVIMTLPKAFRKLSQMNGDVVHNALFQSSAKVLQNWFIEEYGLQIGIVSVLHTAGSDLKYHPHVHMIVSRGGKNRTSGEYKKIAGTYLCPQRELGRRLKELFTAALLNLYEGGKLRIYKRLRDKTDFRRWMDKTSCNHWIVSIQKPLEDVHQIVQYVGRYTKRACLSELKLLGIAGEISFKFNDYKNSKRGEKPKVGICKLTPVEFLDKLLQHVPNKGYKMVRYYGLYNSFHLNKIPELWKVAEKELSLEEGYSLEIEEQLSALSATSEYVEWRRIMIKKTGKDPFYCEYCDEIRVVYQMVYETKVIQVYEEPDTS